MAVVSIGAATLSLSDFELALHAQNIAAQAKVRIVFFMFICFFINNQAIRLSYTFLIYFGWLGK